MDIHTFDPADRAALLRFISGAAAQGDSFTDKMSAEGVRVPELTFTAHGSDGNIIGYISCCEGHVGTALAAFIGELYTADGSSDTAAALVEKVAEEAARLGYVLLAICDSTPFPLEKCGFTIAHSRGIFTAEPDARKWNLWTKNLSEDAAELYGPLGLPWAELPEPDYHLHTFMNEEQYRDAVLNTRRRQRIIESVILGLIVAASIALCIIHRSFSYLGVGIAAGVFMFTTLTRPKKFTEQHLAKLREKYGTFADDTELYFYSDRFVVYDRLRRLTGISLYDKYDFLYLKNDYLFLGTLNLSGYYMTYASMPDKDAFIAYIREKCKGMRVRK